MCLVWTHIAFFFTGSKRRFAHFTFHVSTGKKSYGERSYWQLWKFLVQKREVFRTLHFIQQLWLTIKCDGSIVHIPDGGRVIWWLGTSIPWKLWTLEALFPPIARFSRKFLLKIQASLILWCSAFQAHCSLTPIWAHFLIARSVWSSRNPRSGQSMPPIWLFVATSSERRRDSLRTNSGQLARR